jgi:hypothetical protein
MAGQYLALCQRCNGTGRYDRGACFGCRPFGSLGWVRRVSRAKDGAQVTAIRDAAEGRIDWIVIYNATPKQAVQIVQRQMRVAGKPEALIESVQARVL